MTATARAPYSEGLPGGDYAEWSLAGDGYDISLMKAHYRTGGQATWERSRGVLQYVLACDSRIDLACGPAANDPAFAAVRPLTFVAPGVPMQARWRPGKLHRLICEIDLERLAARTSRGGQTPALPSPPPNLSFDSPFITLMMRRLAEEAVSPGYGAALRVDAIMLGIAIDLIRLLEGAANRRVAANAAVLTGRQLQAVHDLIDSAETVSIEGAAAAFGMSARRLSALYSRSTGVTLRSYIAEARVRRAEALLLDPAMMIKTVAHRCGFSSTAALDAAFRRVTGMTPHQYRETVCARL